MTPEALLERLQSFGAIVEAVDGALEVDAPEQVLTPKVLGTITAHKRELVELLENEAALEAAWSRGCTRNGWPLEVEPARLLEAHGETVAA